MQHRRSNFFGIFILIVIVGALIYKFQLFQVRNVEVSLNQAPCASQSQLQKELKLENQIIFFVDAEKVKKQIMTRYSCVYDVRIAKNLLGGIKIDVVGSNPQFLAFAYRLEQLNLFESTSSATQSALLNWDVPLSSSEGVLMDERGVFIARQPDNQLQQTVSWPIIYLMSVDLKIGSRLSPEKADALKILLKKLPEIEFPDQHKVELAQLKMKERGSDLLLLTTPKVAFSLNKDMSRQLASLQLILGKATIDEGEMNTIDLRFDKPVVTYSPIKKRS